MKDEWSALKKLIWLRLMKAGSYISKIVSGFTPLTLENAVNGSIKSLVQYGKCTQDGIPTPYAPVDIVCNNGALRVNRLDLSAVEDGHYWSATGVYTANASSRLSNTIPVKRGDVIAVTTETVRTGSSLNIRYNQFNASGEWVSQSVYTQSSNAPHTELITIGQDGFFNFSGNYEASVSMYVDWSKVLIINTTDPVFADGTPEVLTVSGKNMFDPTKVLFGYYLDFSTGNKRTSSINFVSSDDGYIHCLPDTAYTFVGVNKTNGTYSKYNTIYFFDSAKNYLGASSYQISQPTTSTTPSNCRYLQVRSNPLDMTSVSIQDAFQQFNWQLELGSTATDYEPYNAQTVSVPTLLGIGNYKDEAELIHGIKTGKVGVKVFDGTETFTASSSGAMITAISDVAVGAQNTPMNTHFALETSPTSIAVGTQRFGASGAAIYSANYYMKHTTITTVADFKAWLASEYANGTPVIVIYPRTNEQTEQTTPHSLHTSAGTNVVDATAAVGSVELEVKYIAKAAGG